MKFSTKTYQVLNDAGPRGDKTFSSGFSDAVNELISLNRSDLIKPFDWLFEKTVRHAEKAYFLDEEIIEKVFVDKDLGDKLFRLVENLNEWDGILLLPKGLLGELEAFTCKLIRVESGDDTFLSYGIIWYSNRGIEIHTTGLIGVDRQLDEASIVASDSQFPGNSRDSFLEEATNFVLRTLLIVQFTDIDLKFVQGGTQYRRRKINGEKYVNETPFRIEIINSNWFKQIIRERETDVQGHLKLQAYGPGLRSRRLILVNSYKRGRYVKPSGKELDERERRSK